MEKDFNILPEGWKRVKFKDYVYFQEGPGLTSDLFSGRKKGVPFLNIRCLYKNEILVDQLQYIEANLAFKKFKHFLLEENDLVVSSSGTLGKSILIKREHLPLLLNTSLIRMRPKSPFLNRFYLKHYVNSDYFQKEIYRLSTGSAQSNYGPSHLKKIFLLLPPLPEQQKIAEILETLDKIIEKTDKIIEKYKRIKQGLMQALLTRGIDEKGRIRDEKTHRFKDSPIGRIPEEWEVVKLGEVCNFKNGKSPSICEDGIYPVYGSNGVIGHAKDYFLDGDFILIGRVGASGEVKFVSGKFWASDNCLIGACKDLKAVSKFIFYLLTFIDLRKFTTQTAQPLITQSLLNALEVPLPPLHEQQIIARIISQVDQVIEKGKKYKQKLERIKKGLMEDLLTGKVRVKISEVKEV